MHTKRSTCKLQQHPVRARCRVRALACTGACLLAVPAWSASPACELHYSVTPDLTSTPRALQVELSFPAGARHETAVRVQSEWAGIRDFGQAFQSWQGLSAETAVRPADQAGRWIVTHPDGATVQLRYRVAASLPDPDAGQPQDQQQLYRPQLGQDWFQFFGYAVLPSVEPWGDERRTRLCVSLRQPGTVDAPAFGSRLWGRGPVVEAAWDGTPDELRHAFYAGGPGWRLQQRALQGGPLMTAVRGRYAVDDQGFADQAAALIGLHRRFWSETASPPQWLVLTPNFQRGNSGGTLVHQTAVLHAPTDFSPALPSFEFLIGHENLHQWFPDRFGLRAREHDVFDYWFSEGFTNHYTHRLLLDSGLWTLDRYADALTEVLQAYWRSPAREAGAASIEPRFFSDRDAGRQLYARGEVLALRWDRALRAQGHPGIDRVLQDLLLPEPATQGPSGPQRLLQALDPLLGALPRRDVEAHVLQGRSLPLDAGLAGPCFALDWTEQPRWSLGFDEASFDLRRLQGLVPGGPAERAGLREGMAIEGWAVHGGQTAREVDIYIRRDGQLSKLSYLPVHGTELLPRVQQRPDAPDSPACLAWQRRG